MSLSAPVRSTDNNSSSNRLTFSSVVGILGFPFFCNSFSLIDFYYLSIAFSASLRSVPMSADSSPATYSPRCTHGEAYSFAVSLP